jgi:hypothetical protein
MLIYFDDSYWLLMNFDVKPKLLARLWNYLPCICGFENGVRMHPLCRFYPGLLLESEIDSNLSWTVPPPWIGWLGRLCWLSSSPWIVSKWVMSSSPLMSSNMIHSPTDQKTIATHWRILDVDLFGPSSLTPIEFWGGTSVIRKLMKLSFQA